MCDTIYNYYMIKNTYVDPNATIETHWRSIILLGKNTASYKFSLAKTLLEFPRQQSLLRIDELALPFALNICEHLKLSNKQHTGSTNSFLEQCRKFNLNEISKEDLREASIQNGFTYVLDAFHNVTGGEAPKFFDDNRKNDNGIILTDNFYNLLETEQKNNFKHEVEARWRLWETAITLKINPRLLDLHLDSNGEEIFVMNENNRRVNVTSSKHAIAGYQRGKCFYCYGPINIDRENDEVCHVDHFFPFMLKQFNFNNVDLIWNLVLACSDCNNGESGKFAFLPDKKYLNELYKRNNYFIESNLPIRESIMKHTGSTYNERKSFIENFDRNALSIQPHRWKPMMLRGEPI